MLARQVLRSYILGEGFVDQFTSHGEPTLLAFFVVDEAKWEIFPHLNQRIRFNLPMIFVDRIGQANRRSNLKFER